MKFGIGSEVIKMAPIIKDFLIEKSFETKDCVTIQHREMLDQVLTFLKIKFDFNSYSMKKNQTLNQLFARILGDFDSVFDGFKPDLVLLHVDTTTSSFAAKENPYDDGYAYAKVLEFLKHNF